MTADRRRHPGWLVTGLIFFFFFLSLSFLPGPFVRVDCRLRSPSLKRRPSLTRGCEDMGQAIASLSCLP